MLAGRTEPSTTRPVELLACGLKMRVPTFVVLCVALMLQACRCGEEQKQQPSAASAAVSAPAPKPPPPPPTPSEEATFETSDGVPLSGTYFDAGDDAPLVVFVHRYRGDRTVWEPLLERLSKSEKRYSMLSFDLRGHGKSTSASGKEQLTWSDLKDDDMPKLVTDVHAAMRYGLEQSNGKAPGVVLIGSSLGAALVAAAAGQEAKVTALAVISPGASIQGQGIYRPFAEVRQLPSFIACAKDDNVCKDPHDALGRMGKEAATVKAYEGGAHGAGALLRAEPALGEDLEAWLMTVYDERPRERRVREPGDEAKHEKKKKGK